MEMKPMLASVGSEDIISRKGFIFEPKLDGIRALCFKKKKLKFTSRNGINITEDYPEFDFFDNLNAKECILDGEIVVYDEKGNPSFQLWGERKNNKNILATYVVFDILYLNGKSLLNIPLSERKKILDKVVKQGKHLQISFYTKNGRDLWEKIKERRLEGIIAKREDSVYELGTRSSSWLKVKITNTIDCVIIGYTTEKRALTSLALGLYDKDKLIFVGKVGTGFNEKMISLLRNKLDKIKLKEAIIETEKGVIAVKPELVAEVEYLLITRDKKLRAPVFLRLRDDKRAEDCVI